MKRSRKMLGCQRDTGALCSPRLLKLQKNKKGQYAQQVFSRSTAPPPSAVALLGERKS